MGFDAVPARQYLHVLVSGFGCEACVGFRPLPRTAWRFTMLAYGFVIALVFGPRTFYHIDSEASEH